ncbi:MAG: glutaredoxin [Candidatus Moranbacteria bacterium]|nr:glutaredoxin [Candidatus Moranbacteria bacterium]
MHKYFFRYVIAVAFFAMTFWVPIAKAENTPASTVLVEVFERQDCAHCQAEKRFLNQLTVFGTDVSVRFVDIDTEEGKNLFIQFTEHQNLSQATPITVIGASILQGFDSAETTGKRIESLITAYQGQSAIGIAGILGGTQSELDELKGALCGSTLGEECTVLDENITVSVPFIGKVIQTSEYSLPVLAGVLGLIDGFNPCAMWVLVTFLLVLLQMGTKRRMWVVAGLFIAAETVMYYLILNVWFTTWDFVGLDRIVTPIVGVLALGGGVFFLYEWYASDGTCKVVNLEQRSKISGRIRKLATEPFTWVTALGVIGLAFSVNIIEFACSIGIPQAFTKIIELNNLGFWQTQGLMLNYIFFYMIDDFLVFGIALWGFEKLYLTERYAKWSNLLGGVLMLILGALLIFAPQFLRFI